MNEIDKNLIEKMAANFSEHLSIDNNERIIFSGKFGMGKSTFINNFFGDSESYNVVYLYPVNYSVASNEDIFKYIKFDILIELFAKGYPIEILPEADLWWKLAAYLQKNFTSLAANSLSALPEVGKEIAIASTIISAWDKVKTQLANIEKGKDILGESETKIFDKFIEDVTKKEGSLYEFGIETMLIRNMLDRKTVEDKKQNVLVIDDLDRIDPEHIFRILNVFAAHFNDQKNYVGNKFGFDKVIMVCDIDNVQNFFHHKYGEEGDFSGYMDKFFSHSVFNYIDFEAINSFARRTLTAISVVDYYGRQSKELFKDDFVLNIVRELIISRSINLRSFSKWAGKQFELKEFRNVHDHNLRTDQFPVINQMEFLCQVIGHKKQLIDAIKRIRVSKMLIHRSILLEYAKPLIEVFTYGIKTGESEMSFIIDGEVYNASRSSENRKIPAIFNRGKDIAEIVEIDMGRFFKSCLLEYLEYLS